MNLAIINGRLTRDPELRTTQSQIPVATFTIAVDRKFKDQSGERQADFLNVVAWRQQAEFVSKYFQKGSKILVTGSIQNRNYTDKDGNKRIITEIIADDVEFGEGKKQDSREQEQFAPIPDDSVPNLPFDL